MQSEFRFLDTNERRRLWMAENGQEAEVAEACRRTAVVAGTVMSPSLRNACTVPPSILNVESRQYPS